MRNRFRGATLAFGLATALAGGAPAGAQAPATNASPPPAALACANPGLPASLLAGPRAAGTPAPAVASVKPGTAPLRLVSARVGEGGPVLNLAVAGDPSTRELGLMCVLRLRPRAGMIFVFPNSAAWEFWMKDTLAPLDMVWVGADGKVTTVAANVPASTLETPDSDVARRRGTGIFVIELRAGEAAKDRIVPGAHLLLPSLRTDS